MALITLIDSGTSGNVSGFMQVLLNLLRDNHLTVITGKVGSFIFKASALDKRLLVCFVALGSFSVIFGRY